MRRRYGLAVAFFCSGIVLDATAVLDGLSAVPLQAGVAYIQSPARGAGSEQGLDHRDWAQTISRRVADGVRLVYIEAEFFGGAGSQAAMGWQGGVLEFGPQRTQTPTEHREGYVVTEDERDMAINAALRWLGIKRTEARDEFDTVGIARCAMP